MPGESPIPRRHPGARPPRARQLRHGSAPESALPQLIPERAVTDLAASRAFHAGPGPRPGEAGLMLDQLGPGRAPAALTAGDRPCGRGVNFQVEIPGLAPLLAALQALRHAPRPGPETRWSRAGVEEIGPRQVRLDDPDGHSLRFGKLLGRRPAEGG